MNVKEDDLALVFGPTPWCGKVVRVLWQLSVCRDVGQAWNVRETSGDFDVAAVHDAHMMPLYLIAEDANS